MSSSTAGHPVRRLLLLVAAALIAVAVRNALADKGGSYDPDDPARR